VPNIKRARVLASSVLPTPVGPRNMNERLAGRGSFRPARARGPSGHDLDGLVLADDPLVQGILHVQQPGGFLILELHEGTPVHMETISATSSCHGDRGRGRIPAQAQLF